jgi:hypothetical protein
MITSEPVEVVEKLIQSAYLDLADGIKVLQM